MKEQPSGKRYLPILSGTFLSGLGTILSACCLGAGTLACSTVCAPTCGALGFSVLGLSSSVIANWVDKFWWVFLLLSSFAFLEAYVRIFKLSGTPPSSRKAKLIFCCSLGVTVLFYTYSFLS